MKLQIIEMHQSFPKKTSQFSTMPCFNSRPSSSSPQKLGSTEGQRATRDTAITAAERLRKVHILIGDEVLWREFQDEVKKSGVVTSVAVELVLNKFISHQMEDINICQQPKKSRWNISKLSLKKQRTDGQLQKSIESLLKKRHSYPLGVTKTREKEESILTPTASFGEATWSMASDSLGIKGTIQRTKPGCDILGRPSSLSLSGSPAPLNGDMRLTAFALRHIRDSDRAMRRNSMSEVLNQACSLTERNAPLQQLRSHKITSTNGFVALEKSRSINDQGHSCKAEKFHGSRFGLNVSRFWKQENAVRGGQQKR